MHYVMSLGSQFCVVVDSTVEYQVTWLQLFKFESYWQSVKLVCLVPSIKVEAKVFSHIVGYLSHQSTAIEEHGSIIEWLSGIEIPLRIRDSEILLCCFKELFSQTLLDSRVLSINSGLLSDILSVLDLLYLLLLKSLEVRSQISLDLAPPVSYPKQSRVLISLPFVSLSRLQSGLFSCCCFRGCL